MTNLIPINYDNDRQTVSARALHEFLEVGTEFRHWYPRMCEYGFSESIDYTPVNFDHPQNKQQTTDYQITIDMAKEICMLQRTEKGKQARHYFIELEKQWNSPEAVFARALKMANQKIKSLESGIEELNTKVKELTPAAEFGNTVGNCQDAILVRDFAKVLANDGIKIGQDGLFEWLEQNGYIFRDKYKYKKPYRPYQPYVNQGLFRVKETPVSTSTHGDLINITLKITGKGQKYFYEKLKKSTQEDN